MRRLFVFLTAIFTILTATAEEEYPIILDQSSVRKMTNLGLDNANIDPIRKDLSRNACARVKIRFANMSRAEVDALRIQFRSNTDLARQEVGYYDNILILEMTAKPTTRFYVQSDTYGQSNEVSLNLEGNCVYEMEARLNLAFSIVVNSNVEGAEVYIDNIFMSRTDANHKATISGIFIGSHTLKLVYGGVNYEQQINVNKSSIQFNQNVNIAAAEPQFVVFIVEPKSAVVTINNQPYSLDDGAMQTVLDAGTYNYTVTAAGYHSQSGTFMVAGDKVEKRLNLTADSAMVTLTAPDNAEIWINGVKKGTATWRGTLNSGTYIFEARKEGYKSSRLSQKITSTTATQSYTLPAPTPIYGSLVVSGTPIAADVTLDGKPVGTMPLKMSNILVGNHTIKISKAGYADNTQTITISEGKATTITATLTKQQISAPTSGTYKIGDLVTIDGVQGIVFQVRPVVKLVSVKETKAKWADSENTTGATDMEDGRVNMEKIISIPDWQTKFPAFKWCADYGSGWYLPAFKELKTLDSQRYSVNSTLSANNMARLTVNDFGWLYMWSSTERGDSGAYPGFCSENGPAYNKKCSFAVRAVYVLDGGSSTSTSGSSTIAGFDMAYVKGGTFTMGATAEQGSDAYDWEKPTHSVTVSDFYIGKYEVTQAQWKAVMGSNPSRWKGDNLPVENVSWNDIQEFIQKLNAQTGKKFRLPTEAEWEYAARGGNQSKGYKYSGSNSIGDVAWYYDNSSSKTHPVGQKTPNELGIYDMSGNVWEWCGDWYGSYSSSSQTNPTGPSSGSFRVLRGGSWSYIAGSCRVSRRSYDPDYRSDNYGFRLACLSE